MTLPTTTFDELATLFRTYAADTDGLYRPLLKQHLPPAGERAVDLGCGSGRFTDLLGDRYRHVLAVDLSSRQIDLARADHPYPNVDYQVRSLTDVTAAADGRFDLVFSVNTLHHVGDYDRVLPHIKSLIAPGGHAVLVDIVDISGGKRASRDWHIEEAFRDARDSYLNPLRSGTPEAAADVLRLRLSERWLELAIKKPMLTRPELQDVYSEVFPDAVFTDVHRAACAMRWVNTAVDDLDRGG